MIMMMATKDLSVSPQNGTPPSPCKCLWRKSIPTGSDCDDDHKKKKTISNKKCIKAVMFDEGVQFHASESPSLSQQEKRDCYYTKTELADMFREAQCFANTIMSRPPTVNDNDDEEEEEEEDCFRGLEHLSREGRIRQVTRVKRCVSVVLRTQKQQQASKHNRGASTTSGGLGVAAHDYACESIKSQVEALERGGKDRDVAMKQYRKDRRLVSNLLLPKRRLRRERGGEGLP
eukprot:CAMPEP_0116827142 /NCGR_PEP_ID=MMETSP0418-20121206/2930_1 /TAXON_ID=1158023 /ORGANISM="Astrosyne radiata, Strain 13vi08-1A" /LENGTH=231 /DNA_ID=CAMNT_0004455875 /DNA_START=72 /DNA_END=767 /DNA_ORIENTATION=-